MKELEQAEQLFLNDVDPETLAENQAVLAEWKQNVARNQAYMHWREHDITKEINQLIKERYKDYAITLATNRTLTNDQRSSLWAKQDACLFLLELTDRDAKTELETLRRDIQRTIGFIS